jgi:hypothetical protein
MNSPMESKTSYSLAVAAVGTALVVLFAGACVIIAVNHQVPQELWAAASVLSGALVGILIPTPSGGGTDQVATAASFTQRAATSAAHDQAEAINEDAHQPTATKKAAKEALARIKDVPVTATVRKVRGAMTPPSEVIDSVVGAFDERWQDARSKLIDAHANLESAQEQLDDAQTKHEKAKAQLQSAEAQAQAGQQHEVTGAAGLEDALTQAENTVSHASLTVKQAEVNLATAKATQAVHAAAAEAAAKAGATATTIADPGSGSGSPGVSTQTIVLLGLAGLVLLAVLAVALWLAMEIAQGNIHPAHCPLAKEGRTQGCDSNLQQIGTVLLSLASAAGGTLLGLFATPDGKPSVASATSTGK